MRKSSYLSYVQQIDVDAFEEAIGFNPQGERANKLGEPMDVGQCLDPWNMHKNGDTTGKFAINRERRTYNCWVCGHGTLLDLTMAIKTITEQEAEEWLEQFAKPIDKSAEEFMDEIEAILYQEKQEQPEPVFYNERVLEKWADIAPLEEWLHSRGISSEIAAKARLGFQANALRMAPIKVEKARERAYEGPCVYLPHFWGGKLVGWQQRWLDDQRPRWVPKYTNTSGFPKVETIYGFENEWYAERPVIIVESVCTCLFLKSMGYPAVATFGASVSEEQMRLLRYFQQGVVIAPDNDPPGKKWISYSDSEYVAKNRGKRIERTILADYLSKYIPVKIIEPIGLEGDDLGDLASEDLHWASKILKSLYEEASYYESPVT